MALLFNIIADLPLSAIYLLKLNTLYISFLDKVDTRWGNILSFEENNRDQ